MKPPLPMWVLQYCRCMLVAHCSIPLVADSSPVTFEIVAFKHIVSIEPGHTKYRKQI